MADDTPPVVTGEGIADPSNQTSAQNTSQEAAPEKKQEPKYVTAEELAQRDAELIRRLKQSDKDRNKAIEKRLGDIQETLKKNNAPLSAQQEAAMRQRIEDEYDDAQDAAPETEELHPLAKIAFPVFQKKGVTIQKGDPEFAKLEPYLNMADLDDTTQAEFSYELLKQIEAKQARLALAKEKADVRSPGGNISNETSRKPLSANEKLSLALKGK